MSSDSSCDRNCSAALWKVIVVCGIKALGQMGGFNVSHYTIFHHGPMVKKQKQSKCNISHSTFGIENVSSEYTPRPCTTHSTDPGRCSFALPID